MLIGVVFLLLIGGVAMSWAAISRSRHVAKLEKGAGVLLLAGLLLIGLTFGYLRAKLAHRSLDLTVVRSVPGLDHVRR
jgi:hypothetical protein